MAPHLRARHRAHLHVWLRATCAGSSGVGGVENAMKPLDATPPSVYASQDVGVSAPDRFAGAEVGLIPSVQGDSFPHSAPALRGANFAGLFYSLPSVCRCSSARRRRTARRPKSRGSDGWKPLRLPSKTSGGRNATAGSSGLTSSRRATSCLIRSGVGSLCSGFTNRLLGAREKKT